MTLLCMTHPKLFTSLSPNLVYILYVHNTPSNLQYNLYASTKQYLELLINTKCQEYFLLYNTGKLQGLSNTY